MPDTLEPLDLSSHNIAADRLADLIHLFPEIRTEGGKIDFDRLRLALGESVDVGKERYGMNWPGKAECFKTIQSPSLGTLLPAPEESVNFDTTENMIIEGDNLEVLKLLQKSYMGKVKMIYIDPPYNTGNDFIYPDNFSESLQTYLEYTGQVDAQGRKFGTNTDADGRFHSKWMNMMYPRLYLARNLLSEDGVICISIDGSESTNLKKLGDEIFGEETFKGAIVRTTGQTTGQNGGGLGSSFDYVFIYAKDGDAELSGLPLDDDDLERYQESDSVGNYALWQLRKTGKNDRRSDRPKMYYPVRDPDGHEVYPIGPTGYESRWRFDQKGYARLVEENFLVWKRRKKDGKDEWWPYVKTYLEGSTKRPSPLWDDIVGNKKASIDLKAIFEDSLFDNPKPVELVTRLLQIAPKDENAEAIILDFFAGSGTTAHAVIDLNKQDGGNRKFILVQLPEPTERADFPTIADITKERVRRVIRKIEAEQEGKLDLGKTSQQDLGFKVFKLSPSNFTTWDAQAAKNADALASQLDFHIDHIRLGRQPHDILYEIILKSGYPLTTTVENLTIEGKIVFSVAEGGFLICLEEGLTIDLIKTMASREPARVVCLDAGFKDNDELKTNAVQTFKSKNIVFKTV